MNERPVQTDAIPRHVRSRRRPVDGGRRFRLLLGLVACVGCAGTEELGHVEGTVLLDGRPLAGGSLAFESPGRRPASARIEGGRILDATTYRLGDGVPVGPQSIAVFAREAAAPADAANPGQHAFDPGAMAGRSLLPPRYNRPGTSGLSASIRSGRNSLELVLQTDPP